MDERTSADSISRVRRQRRPPALPERPKDAHKGTFGNALIVAGSLGMSGAACLAGQAALHSGAGLVTVATPRSVLPMVAGSHPSFMTLPLSEEDGQLCPAALFELTDILKKASAVALGPGLGQSVQVQEFVQELHARCSLPMVLDADGLNAFAEAPSLLKLRQDNAVRVLTPHPGEFSRLTGRKTGEIQSHRQELAVEFARSHGLVVLLKGAGSVITDGERIAINSTGNSALATGGTGDVLTGLIAALLAQGMDAFEAAYLGAYVHGLAGEIAGQMYSEPFVSSLEVLSSLSPAWKRLLQLAGD